MSKFQKKAVADGDIKEKYQNPGCKVLSIDATKIVMKNFPFNILFKANWASVSSQIHF